MTMRANLICVEDYYLSEPVKSHPAAIAYEAVVVLKVHVLSTNTTYIGT